MPMDVTGIVWTGEWQEKWAVPGVPVNADGRLIIESERQFLPKHYLFPLPTSQLQLNSNLKQNPGWEQFTIHNA